MICGLDSCTLNGIINSLSNGSIGDNVPDVMIMEWIPLSAIVCIVHPGLRHQTLKMRDTFVVTASVFHPSRALFLTSSLRMKTRKNLWCFLASSEKEEKQFKNHADNSEITTKTYFVEARQIDWINQSIHRSVNPTVIRSTNQSFDRSISETMKAFGNFTFTTPLINRSINCLKPWLMNEISYQKMWCLKVPWNSAPPRWPRPKHCRLAHLFPPHHASNYPASYTANHIVVPLRRPSGKAPPKKWAVSPCLRRATHRTPSRNPRGCALFRRLLGWLLVRNLHPPPNSGQAEAKKHR